MVSEGMPVQRRIVHGGESVYQAGLPFTHLYTINAGYFKLVNNAADGRQQVVGLRFRGDWLGFEGIAGGRYGCDAVALDTGEVWALAYDGLLAASALHPPLLAALQVEMSRDIALGSELMLSLCTLPAVARVAQFLMRWAGSLEMLGHSVGRITLRMTRAEIGNFLGMTVESVSRAMSELARAEVIAFAGKGHREIVIRDIPKLAARIRPDAKLS